MRSSIGSVISYLENSGHSQLSFKKGRKKKQWVSKEIDSIWHHTQHVFSYAGVNGISHICLAKSLGRRIFWIFLFTISFSGWLYQASALLKYYFEYPAVVYIDVVKHVQMEFPSITICNLNRIRKSEYCAEYPDVCKKNQSLHLSDDDIRELSLNFMMKSRKRQLGHQLKDMVIKCEFSGNPSLDTSKCLKYFTSFYDPKLGNCYMLNSNYNGEETLFVTEPDAWQDLKDLVLVLNVEEDEHINVDETPGIILTVHSNLMYPDAFSNGIHIYSDHSYNLAVEKITVELLKSPYKNNCTDFHDLHFDTFGSRLLTPKLCTVECVIHMQQTKCKHHYVTDDVVLYTRNMPYDPLDITEEDKVCARKISESSKQYCRSLCSVPCLDQTFHVNMDFSPASEQKTLLEEDDKEAYLNRTRINKQVNPVVVRIHYKTMEHKIYKHTPEFTTETLFSYLGGITGGWLGISLLEFCAFLEGLGSVTSFSVKKCCCRKKVKRNPKRFTKIQPYRSHDNLRNSEKQMHMPYGYH